MVNPEPAPSRIRLRSVLAIAAIAAALWVTISTAGWALLGAHPLPYWDAWEFTEDLERSAAGAYTWHDLLRPANEHRIALPRLFFFLDAKWFAGQERALVVAALLMLCALAFLVVRVALRDVRTERGPRIALGAALVAVVCSGTQMSCLAWSFGVQFMAHSLLPALAIACVAGERLGWWRLVLALGAALGATFSIASSLLLWPLLVVLALWCRRGPWVTGLLVAFGGLAWTLYFAERAPTATAGRLDDPLAAVLWSLTHLGSAWQLGQHAALGFGVVGIASLSWTLPRIRRGDLATSERVLLAIATLWVLYSLAIASGRWQLGREEALASRYAPGPLLFWAVVFALHLRLARRVATRRAIAVLLALLVALLAWKQAKSSKRWLGVTAARELASLAIWCGDEHATCLAGVFPIPRLLPPRIAVLREQGLSIFADPCARLFGRPVPEGAVEIPLPPLAPAEPLPAGAKLRFLEGTASRGDQLPTGRIAFVDAQGIVRGLGSSGWPSVRERGAVAGSAGARWFACVAVDLEVASARCYRLGASSLR